MEFGPDGRYLATVHHGGCLRLWDASTHQLAGEKDLGIGELHGLAWLPDSSGLVVGGDRLIAVCETAEVVGNVERRGGPSRGEPLMLRGHLRPIEKLWFSPDGRRLHSWDRERLQVWDMSQGAGLARADRVIRTPCPSRKENQMSLSADGRLLALAGYGGGLWDTQTWQRLSFPVEQDSRPDFLAVTPGGRIFRCDGTTRLLEDKTFRCQLLDTKGESIHESVYTGPMRELSRVAFPSDDNARIYLGFDFGAVVCWTIETGQCELLFAAHASLKEFLVTPDERFAVLTGACSVWSLPGRKRMHQLKHRFRVNAVALTPDGRRVLTACNDGIVRLWSLESGKELLALDLEMGRVETLAIAPDGMYFAAGVVKKRAIVLMDLPED
jgi:WD40 repeat protein